MVAVALLAAGAAAAGIGARATYAARTTSDEPQYLLTALSLGFDGDLDIADQLAEGANRPFHEIPVDPQTIARGADGRQVSPHDPLFPVMLAIPMRLGGWVAAKAVLALLAGVTAGVAWWLAVARFAVRPAVAGIVVAAASVGLPWAAYGSQVYPELPAALVVLGTFGALTSPAVRARQSALAVAGLVALPWLSVKYLPVGAVLGVGLLVRSARRRRLRLVALVVLVVAGLVYLELHRRLYGGWTVYAAGDHFTETGQLSVVGTRVDLLGRSRRLSGLLVDRDFGLVPWSPVWLVLPMAAGALARRRPPGAALLLCTVGAGWLNATLLALTMHGWWVPGRQVVVVLPLAAVAVAWLVDRVPLPVPAVVVAGLVAASNWLWLAVEASTGRRTLVIDFAATAAPAYRLVRPLFPDGMTASASSHVLLGIWTVVLLAVVVAGWRLPPVRSGEALTPTTDDRPPREADGPTTAGRAVHRER
jgi:hypothetical protein